MTTKSSCGCDTTFKPPPGPAMHRCSLLMWLSGLLGVMILYLTSCTGAAHIPPDKAMITLMPKFGPVRFSHLRHSSALDIACEDCHHNITDTDSGQIQGCHACHQAATYRVAVIRPVDKPKQATKHDPRPASARQVLHELCKGCHARRAEQNLPSGPADSCRDCHE